MEIRNHESPGIHIQAIAEDYRAAQELAAKQEGRTSFNRPRLDQSYRGAMKECPQCGKRKDTACFKSHRVLANKHLPTFPICNACRSNNDLQS